MKRRLLNRFFSTRMVAAMIAWGTFAFAEGDSKSADIVFEAPAECPDLSALRERVQQSSPRVEVRPSAASSSPDASTWTLTLRKTGNTYAGLLRSGAGEQREISDASCNSLVSAFAYVVAFSLDPDARPPRAPPQEPPPTKPAPETKPLASSLPSPVPSGKLEGIAALRMEMRGMGSLGPMFGWGAVLAIASQPTPRGLEMGRAFYPSVRLGFSKSFGQGLDISTSQAPAANIFAEWTLGDLEICPVRFGTEGFAFRPCLRGAVGGLSVEGRSVPGASSQTRWYGELGGVARVEGRIDALAFGLDAGLLVPLVRDEFVFLPSTIVFSVPSVIPLVALWAGVRF